MSAPEFGGDIEIVTCPQCDAQQDESECYLGQLGWLTHYRCRYCGWNFSTVPPLASDDELSRLASYFTPEAK